MKPFTRILFAVALASLMATAATAQSTWTNNAAGGMWTNSATWSPSPSYPNGVDSIALFNGPALIGARNVTNDVSITNGLILFNTPVANGTFNLITNNGNGRLYLDVSSGNALVSNPTNAGTGLNQIIIPITTLDPLVVSNNGILNFAGDINNGGNTITFKGTGTTALQRPMTGAGQIELQSGVLNLQQTNAVGPAGGPDMIASGGAIYWGANIAGLIPKALVISNNVALIPNGSGSSSFLWQGGISGPGQLTISNQTITTAGMSLGSNSYTGGTTLTNTVVGVNNSFAFGSGAVTFRGDGVKLTGGFLGTGILNQVVLQGNPNFGGISLIWTNSAWDMDGGSRTVYIDHSNTYTLTLGGLTNGVNLTLARKQNFASTFALVGPLSHTGLTFVDGVTLQLGTTTATPAELVNSTNVFFNNGTLLLDNRGGAASRLPTTSLLTLTNSTLQIIGPGTVGQLFTQQVGAISAAFGANTLTVTNRGTFLLSSLTRNPGASLNINGTNLPTVYVANAPAGATNGIVPWAVLNAGANGFASWSNGILAAYAGYTNALVNDPAANVCIGAATLAAPSTINSLWVSNSAASVNLGGNTLAIASGGLLFGTNSGSSVSNGVVNFGTSEGVVYNDATARINASASGSGGLTKSGAGALSLLGTNTYTGETRVSQGTLALGSGGVISNGNNLVVLQGATFQLSGGSADVNSLQTPSNWIGTPATINLTSGDLITRSNTTVYVGNIGQSLSAQTRWTMYGGSNNFSGTFGTNATLRVSGSNTTFVVTPSLGGVSNTILVNNGAQFTAASGFSVQNTAALLVVEGTNTTFTGANWGVGGDGARLILSNSAVMSAGRGMIGSPYTPNNPIPGYTNSEMIVDGASLSISTASAGYLHLGIGIGAFSNRLTIGHGSFASVSGGTVNPTFLSVGTGATSGYNRAEISGGSILRVNNTTGGAVSLMVGNTNVGGTGNAFILREGSLLELNALTTGTNSIQTMGIGNVISNISSTLQLSGTATVGISITNTPGSIVFTNATLSWRSRADSYVTPILAGTTFTNITWQGDNGFMLNGSTNFAGLTEYTFDSVANTGAPTNFQRLLLTGTNSLWHSARLNIAAGGEMIVSNASGTARVQGIVTNAGTITVVNSSLAFASNAVISGGLVSDPSTITFQSNATVTASGYINATNDTYVFWRDFFNQSTNTSLFRMNQATALFTNGAGVTAHTLGLSNSAALDLGHFTNFGMVAANLSIGTLSIAPGNRLTLTGNKDSQTNALYVGWLDIQGLTLGSTNSYLAVSNTLVSALNLPNINLYYDVYDTRNDWLTRWLPPVTGAGYDLWGGGLLLPIPEPSPFLALGSGLALLVFLRRRKAS